MKSPFGRGMTRSLGDLRSPWLLTIYIRWDDPPSSSLIWVPGFLPSWLKAFQASIPVDGTWAISVKWLESYFLHVHFLRHLYRYLPFSLFLCAYCILTCACQFLCCHYMLKIMSWGGPKILQKDGGVREVFLFVADLFATCRWDLLRLV